MAINPTVFEQYLLELINWARANPNAQAAALGIDLNQGLAPGTISAAAKQPLVFNELLINAARLHSQWMIDTDIFDHTGLNGSSPGDRMVAAGYVFTPPFGNGENIALQATTGAVNEALLTRQNYDGLFRSPGHRVNTMNGTFKELGAGILVGPFAINGTTYNAQLMTENFAYSGAQSFLTGVVLNDTDGDRFYDIGEGVGAATIVASGTGGTFQTTSWAAGGYRLALPTGSYTVTISFGGNSFSGTATIGAANIKFDATLQQMSNLPVNTVGTPGNDALQGSGAAETILGTAGTDTINGGGGSDAVVYAGARAAFVVDLQGATIHVNKPGGGADTLTSVERVTFTDGDLIFDLASLNAPAAYRLYGGAFDRVPDEGGLRFWTTQWLDAGRTLHDVAQNFISLPEFGSLYGTNLSTAQYVDQLYQNVLGRAGDAGGIVFWNGFLNNGTGDRADVLVNFTQLPEYVGNSAANTSDGFWVT